MILNSHSVVSALLQGYSLCKDSLLEDPEENCVEDFLLFYPNIVKISGKVSKYIISTT